MLLREERKEIPCLKFLLQGRTATLALNVGTGLMSEKR